MSIEFECSDISWVVCFSVLYMDILARGGHRLRGAMAHIVAHNGIEARALLQDLPEYY